MDSSQTQLRQHLKQRGFSLTGPRRIVFEILQESEPLTTRQLVANCHNVDRASIYRTISLFEKLGIIQRLQIGWKYRLELTDIFSHHHHHLTCLKCGQVIPFDESLGFEHQLKRIAENNNFTIQNHQLEIQGLCQSCIKNIGPGTKYARVT